MDNPSFYTKKYINYGEWYFYIYRGYTLIYIWIIYIFIATVLYPHVGKNVKQQEELLPFLTHLPLPWEPHVGQLLPLVFQSRPHSGTLWTLYSLCINPLQLWRPFFSFWYHFSFHPLGHHSHPVRSSLRSPQCQQRPVWQPFG